MKIKYFGNGRDLKFKEFKSQNKNFIALFYDRWDDYNYKTQFPCAVICDGEELELSVYIKIYIENTDFSGQYLDKKVAEGWNGEFPIPNENYISLPSDIDFYGALIAKYGLDQARDTVIKLRDVVCIKIGPPDPEMSRLMDSDVFRISLLRESGANKAFQDGWQAFHSNEKYQIGDFALAMPAEDGPPWNVKFRFNSQILPYDINVLIGPNGIGKSYSLKRFVEYWLRIGKGDPKYLERVGHKPFDKHPNLERLIILSYSPFEDFVLDLSSSGLKDQQVYKYFGFRRRGVDASGNVSVKISRNLPSSDAVYSIIECLQEDHNHYFLPNRNQKVETAFQVLKEAIDFDEMAIAIKKDHRNLSPIAANWLLSSSLDFTVITIEETSYLQISKIKVGNQTASLIHEFVDAEKGVIFLKGKKIIELSSGQRMFSFMVINILGAIRNNSLLVIDEPELFLHPNLEITLITLLKDVLRRFASKAIIATHSLVTVREIPANCVHVFRKNDFGRDVVRPPFETFGGDIQRISSYVFGDRSVSKPFESWLANKVKEYGSASAFVKALGTEVNEEMLLRINFEGRKI